jgi:hypothetical protein
MRPGHHVLVKIGPLFIHEDRCLPPTPHRLQEQTGVVTGKDRRMRSEGISVLGITFRECRRGF